MEGDPTVIGTSACESACCAAGIWLPSRCHDFRAGQVAWLTVTRKSDSLVVMLMKRSRYRVPVLDSMRYQLDCRLSESSLKKEGNGRC